MMELIAGQKGKVSDILNNTLIPLSVTLKFPNCKADISCFGLDQAGKLSDDRYFVFYNQLSTPEGAVQKQRDADVFTIDLTLLPQSIDKLVITAAVDAPNQMNQLQDSSVVFGNQKACYALNGSQFKNEKAIILAELYRHQGEWRLAIIGKGFDGGLSALLAHFGGEEVKEEASPAPKAVPISLKKSEKVHAIVLEKAPHLLDLTKKATISLEKQKLSDVEATVVLVLDVSGSMYGQYKKGRVQRILDKVLPLALLFDDNSSLESWGFADQYRQLTNATIDTIKDYVITADGGWKKWNIGARNNEPAVMEALYEKHKDSKLPVYIIFISDGGVNQNQKIKEIMKQASHAPIFWQFVGVGGRMYGILEKLDDMDGRYVDNASFFALDDIDSISDEALYDRLMKEFPLWLKAIKEKGML